MPTIDENILVVGDVHLGVNKNNPAFFKTALEYADWISELCQRKGIKTIVQLGDIFHNREMVHVPTLNCAHEFFERLKKFNIHIVVGNHDCLYNTVSDVHSLKLLKNWPNITVHEKVTSIEGVCFCGWGTRLHEIPSGQKVIFGHFDIKGFEMSANKISEHGFSAADLMEKCDLLMSGHYHKPQVRFYDRKPLVYAGSAYQLNWGEAGEDKYAYVLNTETLAYKPYINNVSPRFEYIRCEEDYIKAKNNFVSIEVENPEEFASTVAKLKSMNAVDVRTTLKPIRMGTDLLINKDEDAPKAASPVSVETAIDEYVALLEESDEDKKLIADKLKALYNRCV